MSHSDKCSPEAAEGSPRPSGRNGSTFVSNPDCAYFPCHQGIPSEAFNCLFCYCPLYALGDACGGQFRYTETGVKDCSGCILPHTPDGYRHIQKRIGGILQLASRKPRETEDPQA